MWQEDDENAENLQQRMRDLLAESHLTMASLLKRLKLEDKNVLAVYLLGSRLWGTATHASDYDFLIVHSSWKGGHSTLHNGEIDASILDFKEFKRRIEEEHHFLETICMWLPPEYKWKENFDLKKTFKLQPLFLLNSIEEETQRDWSVAEKFINKGKLENGKKTIVHAIRLVLVASQIVKEGRVSDYTVAYTYSDQMKRQGAQDFESIRSAFQPAFRSLFGQFKDLCLASGNSNSVGRSTSLCARKANNK